MTHHTNKRTRKADYQYEVEPSKKPPNNFSNNIKVGTKVLQGDVIGYVGSTGLATGPHLHYEFHINGKHTNPVNIKPTNAAPINSYNLANFNKIVNERSKLIDNLSNNE